MISIRTCIILFFIIALASCSNYENVELDTTGQNWSIPLINSSFAVNDAGDNPSDNVVIEINEEEQVTIKYTGEVLYEDTGDIFFPFPILQYFPVLDTVSPLLFPVPEGVVIEKTLFDDFTEVAFRFSSTQKENLDVHITIPDFTKDGKVFETDVFIPYLGEDTTMLETPLYNMDDWLFESDNNTFIVNYDARLPNGERVKLDSVHMYVKAIHFKFGQGFFGRRTYNIKKDIIEVGIFKNWLSGGFTFDQPKVTMLIQNSFGFPVSAIFNTIELTSINGTVFFLESDILSEGVSFPYPSLNEMGETKTSSFDFTNDNSNIGQIFNEKTEKVYYDLEASTNPQEEDLIGFFNEESFYRVDIAVDVPLLLAAKELVLTDTASLTIPEEFNRLKSAKLVWNVRNAFPIDVDFKTVFLDANGQTLNSFPLTDWINLPGTNSSETTIDEVDVLRLEHELDEAFLETIKQAKNVAVLGRFNSEGADEDKSIWITNNQAIEMIIGLEAQL